MVVERSEYMADVEERRLSVSTIPRLTDQCISLDMYCVTPHYCNSEIS